MTAATLPEALSAAVELLTGLSRDRVAPDEALARVAALRSELSGLRMELVWERSELLGDRHYDLLIHDGTRTTSLSTCAGSDVPWPMRGVLAWSDKDLVVVNGQAVGVGEAIASLDFTWRELDVGRHLVDQELVRQLVGGREIPGLDLGIGIDGRFEIDDETMQAGFDDFRRRRGLESSEALEAWLSIHGLTLDQLEPHVRGAAAHDRIRRAVTAGAIGAHFEAHARDYDRVDVLRAGPLNHADLAEVLAAPRRLADIAERAFLTGEPVDLGHATYFRHQLAPEQADALFAASAGAVVGPFDGEVARVLRHRRAGLDEPAVRRAIEDRLFAAWLADRRRDATITWLWGDAAAAATG